jgi:hypothetical protein
MRHVGGVRDGRVRGIVGRKLFVQQWEDGEGGGGAVHQGGAAVVCQWIPSRDRERFESQCERGCESEWPEYGVSYASSGDLSEYWFSSGCDVSACESAAACERATGEKGGTVFGARACGDRSACGSGACNACRADVSVSPEVKLREARTWLGIKGSLCMQVCCGALNRPFRAPSSFIG